MEPTNIFFIITTVFVGVLILLFTIITFYVWKMMKIGKDIASSVQELSHSLREEGKQVIGTAQKFRENVTKNKTTNKIVSGLIFAALGKIFKKKKSK